MHYAPLCRQQDYAGALQCYQRCLELPPADVLALINSAAVHIELGQWEQVSQWGVLPCCGALPVQCGAFVLPWLLPTVTWWAVCSPVAALR